MNINTIYVYKGEGYGPVSTSELIRSLRLEGLYPIETDPSYLSLGHNRTTLHSIIVGGGHSPSIGIKLSKLKEPICEWLAQSNHSFIGICAGAIVASSRFSQFPGSNWNSSSQFLLHLYPGKTYGPGYLGPSFPNRAELDPFSTSRSVKISVEEGKSPADMYWNLGPHFDPDCPNQETLATYAEIALPAVIAVPYEKGHVILSGPHPETRATPGCAPQIEEVANRCTELKQEENIVSQHALFLTICIRAGIIEAAKLT